MPCLECGRHYCQEVDGCLFLFGRCYCQWNVADVITATVYATIGWLMLLSSGR